MELMSPMLAAAANWLALAHQAARLVPDRPSILIDIGTTTTDLISMAEGIVAGGGAALLHAVGALDASVTDGGADVTGDHATGVEIVRRALTEPTYLIATNAGYPGHEVVAEVATMDLDEGFDALAGRYGNMIDMGIIDPLRVCRSALQNGASVAGLLLTTNTLIAEEQTAWGGSRSLMTEFGQLDEGLHQPSPDSSTPQSLGLGPSVG